MFIILLFFFPIVFFLLCFLFAFFFNDRRVFYCIFSIYLFMLWFIVLFYFCFIVKYNLVFLIILKNWLLVSILHLDWCVFIDSLSICMLFVVISISILVHIYSLDYMKFDLHFFKFISFLSLFTFFMLVLVVSSNFIQLFVGWEGVGLCSYLLISFWNSRIQANKSAIKAMLVNRVGDFGLMLSFLFIFCFFKSFNFFVIFPSVLMFCNVSLYFLDYIYINLYNLICFFIFVGAVGKSAQFGLHVWLPDAMEGPTPVSALIHAATMVTAGVFIIIRSSAIFEFAPFVLYIITILGAITAFYSATIGLVQNDIKRVIAFSTCSQLGYMVLSCGLSNYSVGLFHLMTHAFFKALLFLSAGCVIHSLLNEQDMRKMGGLRLLLPFTYCMFFIGSLALVGFPFLSGFYSKDLILEFAFVRFSFSSHFAYWLGSLAAIFTSFYSVRLLCLVFLTTSNITKEIYVLISESSILMLVSLFVLSVASIFCGFIFRDVFVGISGCFFGNSIFNLSSTVVLLDSEILPNYIKMLPLLFSLAGGILSVCIYLICTYFYFSIRISRVGRLLYIFFNRRWFIDKIYSELLSQNLLRNCYYSIFFYLDRGLLEKAGSMFFSNILSWGGSKVYSVFSGFLFEYLFIYVMCLLFFISFNFFFFNLLLIMNLFCGILFCLAK